MWSEQDWRNPTSCQTEQTALSRLKNSPVALAIFVADLYVQQSSLFETGNDAI